MVGCSNGEEETAAPDDRNTGGTASSPAPSGFERRTAEVNGVRLHYEVGGQGPAVVFIHGFPETHRAWRGVMEILAEEYTVIAPDLRGVGGSSLEESGYDKETLAEDVYALVHGELGHDRVAVVGHDLGAMVAYAYTRRHREEVSHLVFMSAALPGFGLEELMDFSKPRSARHHLVFFQSSGVPEELIKGQERYYLERFIGSEAVERSGALNEYVSAYSRPGRLGAALKQYRTLYRDGEDNRREAMPKLTMPVLALDGEHGSPGLPLGSMRRVAENVEGDAVEGAGHYLHEEQPEAVAERLLAFLR